MNLSRPAFPVGEEMHRVTYVFIKKAEWFSCTFPLPVRRNKKPKSSSKWRRFEFVLVSRPRATGGSIIPKPDANG